MGLGHTPDFQWGFEVIRSGLELRQHNNDDKAFNAAAVSSSWMHNWHAVQYQKLCFKIFRWAGSVAGSLNRGKKYIARAFSVSIPNGIHKKQLES